MKLRNKTTAEIGYLISANWNETALIIMDKDGVQLAKYTSLAELNEEWEDYEESEEPKEPKKYWFINSVGGTASYYEEDEEPEDTEACKEIGNYFETEEEAEKAVEKLKAFKRLKDKGFRFEGWDNTERSTIHNFSLFVAIEDLESINKDLDLLFSGEDD